MEGYLKFKIFILILILIFNIIPNTSAGQLEKVDGRLKYLYNFFFNPDLLNSRADSIIKVDTSVSGPTTSILVSAIIPVPGFDLFDWVSIKDGIPFINGARIFSDSNYEVLRQNGIEANPSNWLPYFAVTFALEKLPEISSLELIDSIGFPDPLVEDDSEDSNQVQEELLFGSLNMIFDEKLYNSNTYILLYPQKENRKFYTCYDLLSISQLKNNFIINEIPYGQYFLQVSPIHEH